MTSNIQTLVKVFGKWPSFALVLLATLMPVLVALIALLK
jgi:hypothetical protein